MNSEVASQLKSLIKHYGTDLCDDPKRCRALLLDICGNYKKEIHVLVSALENGIPGELLTSQNIPFEILRNRLVKKLSDEFALADQAAGWSIDTWAFALEIRKDMPDCAITEEDDLKNYISTFLKCGRDGLALLDKGTMYLDLGNYLEALQYLNKAHNVTPKENDMLISIILYHKGRALVGLKRYKEALCCCEKALKIDPQLASYWNNMGYILSKLDRYEEALLCYDKALEIDPQHYAALTNKAFLLSDLGRG